MEQQTLPQTPLRDEWICSECFMRMPRTQVLLRDRREHKSALPDRRLRRHMARLYGADVEQAEVKRPWLDWRLLPEKLVTVRDGDPQWRTKAKNPGWAARACPFCHSEARRLLMGQQPMCVVSNSSTLRMKLRKQPVQAVSVRDLTAKWVGFEQGEWHRQYTGWCEHWVRKVGQRCQWLTLPRRMPRAEPLYLAELQTARIRQASGFLLLLETESSPAEHLWAEDSTACEELMRLQKAYVDLPRLRQIPAAAVVLLPQGELLEQWKMQHPRLTHLLQDTFAQLQVQVVSAEQPEEQTQAVSAALDWLGGIPKTE